MEKSAMNVRRKIGNKLLTLVMRLLYSIDVKDSQSGMWVMKKSFVSKIKLRSDDMSMSEEIKIIAFRKFKADEADGKYYARSGTAKLKEFQDGWKNLTYLIGYRRKLASAILPFSSSAKEKERTLLSE
jgi:hypothetical protein